MRVLRTGAPVLVAGLLLAGCGTPDNPSDTAVAWADKAIHDDQAAKKLECGSGSPEQSLHVLALVVTNLDGFEAEDSTKVAKDTWKVTLRTKPTDDNSQTVDVTVVRKSGRYLVCTAGV